MSLILDDVSKFITSKVETSNIDETNYVSTENMLPNKGGVSLAASLPDTKSVRHYLPDDILINNIRPYFKKIWFANKEGGCSNDVFVLRANENYDSKFLYYVLSSDDFFSYVMANAKGTKMPRGDKKAIQNYIVPDFSIKDQITISHFLSNIDKKIEINKKINKNLDTILNSIFKEQFINNFSPENEKLIFKKIGDLPLIITDYVANGSFASLKENVSILDEEDYAYFIRNTDLKSQNFEKYVNKHSYDFLKKSSLFGNEVIISNVGDVGSVFLCPFLDKPMTLGNNMILVKTKENSTNLNFYLFLLFNSEFGQYLLSTVTSGSVQLKFNKTEFKSLELFIPKDKYLKEFNNTISPIFEYKTKISDEIKNLNNLRDSLLPKLMSGEIDVSQINCDLD